MLCRCDGFKKTAELPLQLYSLAIVLYSGKVAFTSCFPAWDHLNQILEQCLSRTNEPDYGVIFTLWLADSITIINPHFPHTLSMMCTQVQTSVFLVNLWVSAARPTIHLWQSQQHFTLLQSRHSLFYQSLLPTGVQYTCTEQPAQKEEGAHRNENSIRSISK